MAPAAKSTKKRTVKKLVKQENDKVLTNFIKKTVDKMTEVKQQSYTVNSAVVAIPSTGWNTLNNFPITPYSGYIDITQGDGQGQRTGNMIRVKRSVIDIVIWPNFYSSILNPEPRPVEVIIWIYKLNNNDTKPADLGAFFNTGSASVNPSGTLIDLVRPYNTDVYTVYKRIVKKLSYAANVGTGSSDPDLEAAQFYANNDYKYNHIIHIDVTKYLPAKVKYNDTTSLPFTQQINMAIEVVNADGSGMITAGIVPAYMYYNQTFDYYDL